MKLLKKQHLLIFVGTLAIILVVAAVILIFKGPSTKQFAEPDKKLASGSVQLCSDYANLCFTRPADWTRSSILHAGLAKNNDLEINPPTGTILRFEAISRDTAEICPTGDRCDIDIVNLTPIKDGINIVSGVFDAVPTDSNTISGHTPFVQLMSAQDIHSYGLRKGRTTYYTTFNPGISFDDAPKVMMQVSPGKEFDAEKALRWLSSNEGTVSKQVLASVQPY